MLAVVLYSVVIATLTALVYLVDRLIEPEDDLLEQEFTQRVVRLRQFADNDNDGACAPTVRGRAA